MKSKNIILLFCIIEILLVIPRTISYILIDIIPVRIFSLPLVTFSFLVTITGYLFTEIFANRKILKSLQKFRLIILIWSSIVVLSTFINPLRDVIFESQGMIIFMMNIVTFSVASVYLGLKRKLLIWGVFYSIAGIIFAVVFILTVNPILLPEGYSQDGLRYEGLFSSTPIMALASLSTAFVFFYKKGIRIIGVFGIIIAFSGLIFAATRSAMAASLISSFIVIFYTIRSKKMSGLIISLFIVFPLIIFVITKFIDLFPVINTNIEYALSRIDKLSVGSYDSSRIAEMLFEFDLFLKSPLFGHGYGIMNQYTIPFWGTNIFGHNFISSLLARTGILGGSIMVWFGFYIFKRLSYPRNLNNFELFAIAKGALLGAIFLIMISNFAGYQTFGIYGVLVGIAVGSNITIYRNNTF